MNPKEIEGTTEDEIIRITDGGCDYTFECIGNIHTMVRILNLIKLKLIHNKYNEVYYFAFNVLTYVVKLLCSMTLKKNFSVC